MWLKCASAYRGKWNPWIYGSFVLLGITQRVVECLAQLYKNVHINIICMQMIKHSWKTSLGTSFINFCTNNLSLETLILLFFYIETFAAVLVLAFWQP